MGRGLRTGRLGGETPAQSWTPGLCPRQGEGKRPFPHRRVCVPAGAATLPPPFGKLTLPTPLLGGGRAPDFGSFIWVH